MGLELCKLLLVLAADTCTNTAFDCKKCQSELHLCDEWWLECLTWAVNNYSTVDGSVGDWVWVYLVPNEEMEAKGKNVNVLLLMPPSCCGPKQTGTREQCFFKKHQKNASKDLHPRHTRNKRSQRSGIWMVCSYKNMIPLWDLITSNPVVYQKVWWHDDMSIEIILQ